jgi:hypothetical protein
VLIGRDALRRQLAAEPVGLLGEDHRRAAARRGQRGGHAAQPAAGDQHIGSAHFHKSAFVKVLRLGHHAERR